MYDWRKMNAAQRNEVLRERKGRKLAWHAPPHWKYEGKVQFIVTAARYEHMPIIGHSVTRMAEFESELLKACNELGVHVYAWCILLNHYHILIQTDNIEEFRRILGKIHGSTSFRWNGEEDKRGRKVWYRSFDRPMKSDRHFWASVNYIHNNPVRHGYCQKWQDWSFSSADNFIEKFGRGKTIEIWNDYPTLDYGKGWDD
jgi:putative transposase